MGCDSNGLVRVIHGHEPGSINDITCYYNSILNDGVSNGVILNGDKYLADGIFARIEGPFITPVCYLTRNLRKNELKYNWLQTKSRSIIEHYFSRLKITWGLLGNTFNLNKNSVDIIVRTACILTNVIIKYMHPLK